MARVDVPLSRLRFGETQRRDAWWLMPLVTFIVFSSFIVYATWAAFQGAHYTFGPYLSPFYSPVLFGRGEQAWFAERPAWIPAWITLALLILPFPGGFRFTCYYYRGAYYKAFWADPPSCAVGEPRKSYSGERSFPLDPPERSSLLLYVALIFIVHPVVRRLAGAVVRRTRDGATHFGIGVGTLVLAVNVVLLGVLHASAATRCATSSAAAWTSSREPPGAQGAYDCVELRSTARHMLFAWCSLFSVGVHRPLRPPLLDGRICTTGGSSDDIATTYQIARARRARHRRRRRRSARGDRSRGAPGVSVGLVCKSLLGKAHTVMAEGGMAAALGNVDDRDNWKVHFADTMRGGQYLNNWRMAELHAKEAPDRVRELEAWGAVFDRTKDGRILQRNFGGHRYPRLAHVGDRTGLELIRTLQDHGIHQGIDVHMECTVVALLKDGDRVAGAFAYDRERGRFRVFKAQGGRPRDRRHRPRVQDHVEQLGVHRRRPRARVRRGRRADRHGVHAVPSDRHGLAAERARHPRHRRRARRRRHPQEQRRPPLHVRRHPGQLQAADRGQRGRGLALHAGRQERAPSARAADARPRRALHHPRGQGGPRLAARRRVPRHRVDQGAASERARSTSRTSCRACITSSRSWPTSTSRTSRWKSGRRRTTSWAASASTPTRRCRRVPGLFAARRVRRGHHGANRLGGNSLSDLLVFGKRAGEYAAKFAKDERRRARSTTAQVDAAAQARAGAVRARGQRREPVSGPARPAGDDAGRSSASCASRTR